MHGVDVLWKNAQHAWRIDTVDIEEALGSRLDSTTVSFLFLSSAEVLSNPSLQSRITTAFSIPDYLWSDVCQNLQGFYSCNDIVQDNQHPSEHSSWFRFFVKQTFPPDIVYVWHEMSFLVSWRRARKAAICLNTPTKFIERLKQNCETDGLLNDAVDPYSMHCALLREILDLYHTSVWSIRDLIRNAERMRTNPKIHTETDFVRFHEIARHAIHSSETLAVAEKSANLMADFHKMSFANSGYQQSQKIQLQLEFWSQMIANLKARSEANHERLKNEINLAFNLEAQRQSRMFVAIGRATQTDSSAMKTVAVVSLVFLPATFVSALFSTSFFNLSSDGKWLVSNKFWIYWAISIPLTGIATLTWAIWQRYLKVQESSYRRPSRDVYSSI